MHIVVANAQKYSVDSHYIFRLSDGEEISTKVTKPCLLKSGGHKNLSLPYDLLEVMGLPSPLPLPAKKFDRHIGGLGPTICGLFLLVTHTVSNYSDWPIAVH